MVSSLPRGSGAIFLASGFPLILGCIGNRPRLPFLFLCICIPLYDETTSLITFFNQSKLAKFLLQHIFFFFFKIFSANGLIILLIEFP